MLSAFELELLPTEEGARILPDDARPLVRKINATIRQRPFILAKMISLALSKFAISRKAPDVGEVVRNQAEVEQNRFVTSMGMITYLTWAIPAIGFLGTVRGLAGGLSNFRNVNPADKAANAKLMETVTDQLGSRIRLHLRGPGAECRAHVPAARRPKSGRDAGHRLPAVLSGTSAAAVVRPATGGRRGHGDAT